MQFPHSMVVNDINLLYNLYNEPGRYYHNLDHIKFMLAKLFEFESNGGFALEGAENVLNELYEHVSFAVWWHDAAYNSCIPTAGYNEIESAKLFSAGESYLSAKSKQLIKSAILSTSRHLDEQKNLDIRAKLLLDLDLAALSLPIDLVVRNTANLMRERIHVGDFDANILNGQDSFLTTLSNKPRIFYTEYFYNTHEVSARKNISSLLENYACGDSLIDKALRIAKEIS